MEGIIKEILWISLAVGILGGTLALLWATNDIHNVLINWTPPSYCC